MTKLQRNLLSAMKYKNSQITAEAPEGAPEYLTEEDFTDLAKWPDPHITNFIQSVKHGASDSAACPWCARYSGCRGCTYAKRHGNCYQSDSTYYTLTDGRDALVCYYDKEHFLDLLLPEEDSE